MDLSMFSRSKGQAFAPDFLVSVSVFGVMATVFLLSWNTMIDGQIDGFEERNNFKQGERTMQMLIMDSTKNWTDPGKAGLAQEPYVLNNSQIQAFESLSHNEQVSLLQAQNFSLNIESSSVSYSMGYEPDGSTVIPYRRNVLIDYNGSMERAEVEYIKWQ